ncbi:MAG TPA: hypothetical protein VEB22_15385 [Phycisphaerales bacterium]|nr:hypothetical protein [Phycisphaerales bacterium]
MGRRECAVYDELGRLVPEFYPLPRGGPKVFGPNGDLRIGTRRLALVDAIASGDPGSRLAAPITDSGDGAGLVWQITSGWGSTDWTGAWPYLIFPFSDMYGFPPEASRNVGFCIQMVFRGTLPPAGPGAIAVAALVNETSLTTGTVDGRGMNIFSGSATGLPGVGNAGSANGAGSLTFSSSVAGVASGQVGIQVDTFGSGARIANATPMGRDSAGEFVTKNDPASETACGNPSRLYLALAVGRNTNTVDGFTFAFDTYISPIIHFPYEV